MTKTRDEAQDVKMTGETLTMKQTAISATPAIKYINGIPFVRVIDLAHRWDTATSNVLAVGKPHHVPEEYLRRIDGRVWCSFPGLRYRLTATHTGSRLTRHIREFLDAQAEKKPLESEPAQSGEESADPIAAVQHDAAEALAKAAAAKELAEANADCIETHTTRIGELMDVIHDIQGKITGANTETFAANEKATQAINASHATRNRSRNNAHRLTRQTMRIDKLEQETRGKLDAMTERVRFAERRQQDDRARIVALEEKARALDWTITGIALLSVAARLIRRLYRR